MCPQTIFKYYICTYACITQYIMMLMALIIFGVLIYCFKHVGTEDGKVYKCSKAYSAHYLDVYEVHMKSMILHTLYRK